MHHPSLPTFLAFTLPCTRPTYAQGWLRYVPWRYTTALITSVVENHTHDVQAAREILQCTYGHGRPPQLSMFTNIAYWGGGSCAASKEHARESGGEGSPGAGHVLVCFVYIPSTYVASPSGFVDICALPSSWFTDDEASISSKP